MTLHHAHDHQPPKSLAEHGVCFGTIAGVLVAAAVILQWILNLTP